MVPYCPYCDEFRFPVFSVAISSIIYNKDFSKTLLVKQYSRDWNILVAGYVSKGENLEEALVREIKEEVGLDIKIVQYNESKYFEKSNSLICNFITQTNDEKLTCNSEIDFARWYMIDEAKTDIMQGGLAQYFFLQSLNKIS